MQKVLSNKLLIAALITICLVFLSNWLSSSQLVEQVNELDEREPIFTSKIQAIGDAAAQIQDQNFETNDIAKQQLQRDFGRAQYAINHGDHSTAINLLNSLISHHPKYIELYINLASVYAENGRLDQAREVLQKGLNADKNTGILFSHLQKILGALAANAYQKALLEEGDSITILELLRVNKLDAPDIGNDTLKSLNQTLQTANKQLDLAIYENSLLERKLKNLESRLNSNEKESIDQNNNVLALQDELSGLKQQINQRKTTSEKEQTVSIVADKRVIQDRQKQNAIALVKSWAAAWSDQKVEKYTSHYSDNYAPGISHSRWLEHRRIRLTNKTFIKVDVSNFQIIRMENQFSVTFSQRYRSNSLDDTIQKRLTFSAYSKDWSQAKIINERVIK